MKASRPRDGSAAAPSFRIGRKRIVATGAEALARWTVQQGILPRAEGGTQRPPAERLAELAADPACALPFSGLDGGALVALRGRRLGALGHSDAVLVEQAALAAAITALCELHALDWPHPLAEPAADGMRLIGPEALAQLAATARRMGATALCSFEIALATGARFAELDALRSCSWQAEARCLALPGRRVQLAEPLAARVGACGGPGAGIAALAATLGIEESSFRLTALTARLVGGSHLDEAFTLAGCGGPAIDAAPPVPWLG